MILDDRRLDQAGLLHEADALGERDIAAGDRRRCGCRHRPAAHRNRSRSAVRPAPPDRTPRAGSGRPGAGFPGCGRTVCPPPPRAACAHGWSGAACRIPPSPSPCREPLRKGGAFSSRLAVTSTWVSPNLTRQEPSAWRAAPGSRLTERRDRGAVGEAHGAVYLEVGRPGRLPSRFAGSASNRRRGPINNRYLSKACSLESFTSRLTYRRRWASARAKSSAIWWRPFWRRGEPVGSRTLSQRLPLTLSPASIRNVMADLEAMGLLYAPHTSAGRVPTEKGLRLFVDGLLEIGELAPAGTRRHRGAHDRQRPAAGGCADPGDQPAVRPVALRRTGGDGQAGCGRAEACRIRPGRSRQGAGDHGERGRPGGKPRHRHARRPAGLGADGSLQLSQCAAARPHHRRGAGRNPGRTGKRARHARFPDRQDRGRRAGHPGAARRRCRRQGADRARHRRICWIRSRPRPISSASAPCSTISSARPT